MDGYADGFDLLGSLVMNVVASELQYLSDGMG